MAIKNKILKLISLLTIALMGSCTPEKGGPNSNPFYGYSLFLSFQDESRNDLVDGIEFDNWEGYTTKKDAIFGAVKPDLYLLEIVFPDGMKNPGKPDPMLGIVKGEYASDDYYYLTFGTSSYRNQPFEEKITFRVKCPYVFGDNAIHDIVTWWVYTGNHTFSAKCYRIEFDGKEYTQITYEQGDQMSMATIILESR